MCEFLYGINMLYSLIEVKDQEQLNFMCMNVLYDYVFIVLKRYKLNIYREQCDVFFFWFIGVIKKL